MTGQEISFREPAATLPALGRSSRLESLLSPRLFLGPPVLFGRPMRLCTSAGVDVELDANFGVARIVRSGSRAGRRGSALTLSKAYLEEPDEGVPEAGRAGKCKWRRRSD